ncbi:hypothetical protein CEUSTIGMA_g13036.t1, partial [Chlamydomonas eustigma]
MRSIFRFRKQPNDNNDDILSMDTTGFESPAKEVYLQQVAKQEVYSFLKGNRKHRYDVGGASSAASTQHPVLMIPSSDVSNKGSDQGYLLSHKATKPGAGDVSEMTHQLQFNSNEHHSLEAELSFAASSAAVETSGRHESLSVTIPSKCYEEGPWGDVQAIDRISNNDTTSRDNRCPPTASTTAIMATRSRQQDCISGNRNNEDKIELLMRDVAARIIQTYWRTWRAWKRKLRSDAEERTLRMFLDSGSGCHVSATSSHKSLLPAASDRTSVISCSTSHNAIMPAATHYLTGHNLDTPNGSAASSSDHQHTSGVDQHVNSASTASTGKSLQPASSSVRHPKPAALNNIGAAAESASKVAENSGGASSRSPTSSQRAGIIISQAGHAAEERSTTNSSRAKGRNVSALPGGAGTGSEGEAWRMASKTAKGVPPATIRGSSTARGTKQRVTATKQAAATTAVQVGSSFASRPQQPPTAVAAAVASAQTPGMMTRRKSAPGGHVVYTVQPVMASASQIAITPFPSHSDNCSANGLIGYTAAAAAAAAAADPAFSSAADPAVSSAADSSLMSYRRRKTDPPQYTSATAVVKGACVGGELGVQLAAENKRDDSHLEVQPETDDVMMMGPNYRGDGHHSDRVASSRSEKNSLAAAATVVQLEAAAGATAAATVVQLEAAAGATAAATVVQLEAAAGATAALDSLQTGIDQQQQQAVGPVRLLLARLAASASGGITRDGHGSCRRGSTVVAAGALVAVDKYDGSVDGGDDAEDEVIDVGDSTDGSLLLGSADLALLLRAMETSEELQQQQELMPMCQATGDDAPQHVGQYRGSLIAGNAMSTLTAEEAELNDPVLPLQALSTERLYGCEDSECHSAAAVTSNDQAAAGEADCTADYDLMISASSPFPAPLATTTKAAAAAGAAGRMPRRTSKCSSSTLPALVAVSKSSTSQHRQEKQQTVSTAIAAEDAFSCSAAGGNTAGAFLATVECDRQASATIECDRPQASATIECDRRASATIECDRQASATIECDRQASATIECDRQASATIECDRQASGGELPSTGSRTASLGVIILPQAALKQYTSASYPTATANTVAASARGGEATSAVVQTISQPLSTAVERNSLSENVFSLSTGVPAAAAATGQMLSLPTSSSRSFGAASRSEGGLQVLTASLTSDKLQSILDFLDDVDEQHVAEDGPSSSSATEVLLTKSSESSARACGSKSSSKVHSSSHDVQKLLTRHKAELLAGQQAAADEARRQLEAVAAQHEVIMRQQRDKMLRDQEDAVDRERQAAQGRLREASERYEQQLQTQRMRLMADADLRFESLEGSRRDERKHSEEALAKAAADAKAREVRVLEESKLEREALRKTYDKQLEALREQYETGQEGWRAAIAERARREVSEREAAIKEKLTRERDEEVEAIILRLEAEHASSLEETHQKWKKKEESIVKKHVNALQEAKKAEA